MRTPKVPKVLGAMVAIMLLATSCGGPEADPVAGEDLVLEGETIASVDLWAAAQKEGEVTLYTADFEEGEIALGEVFTEDTGIDVNIVRLPGTELNERILSEYGADLLEADVINQSDFARNLEYLDAGITTEYQIPEELDANIPDKWKGENGAYYGTYIHMVVIIYNNKLVDPADVPSSWEDLLDPRWKNKIAMTYAGIGGSGWALALFQRQELGENYWEKLAAQEPIILESSSIVVEEVARGEYPIAINDDATSAGVAATGAPVTIVYPEDGTPSYQYALSKVADSAHSNAAGVYMNWRNSLKGLSAAGETVGVYTPYQGAPPPMGANDERRPPFDEIDPWAADTNDWLELRDEYVAQWNEVFSFNPP